MLNEDALVLFAATGACALLILGVLELVRPTRAHPSRRTGAPERDPWRRARGGQLPTRPGGIFAREAATATPVDIEPPIERLLLSEAATLAPPSPPSSPVRGPIASPLPPPREPAGSTFAGRRPASAFSPASSSPTATSAP